jgi:hypothetical protein
VEIVINERLMLVVAKSETGASKPAYARARVRGDLQRPASGDL